MFWKVTISKRNSEEYVKGEPRDIEAARNVMFSMRESQYGFEGVPGRKTGSACGMRCERGAGDSLADQCGGHEAVFDDSGIGALTYEKDMEKLCGVQFVDLPTDDVSCDTGRFYHRRV